MFQAEKLLQEHGETLSDDLTDELTSAMEQAKAVNSYDDVKEASVRMSDALQSAGASLYQQTNDAPAEQEQAPSGDDDVIDAEFEESDNE